MISNVVTLPLRLQCSSCGATANAGCDCGVAYLPAGQRAAAAVAATPEKSDRAIAVELGVSAETVRRARSPATNAAPRIGLDGKTYPAPKPAESPRDDRSDALKSFEEGPIAWHNRALNAATMAEYAPFETCPKTRKMLKAIELVIVKWTALKESLEKEMNSDDS